VIDISASMQDNNKLVHVKNSLHFLLDFLGQEDQISIITFSDKASIILPPTNVTTDEKENIRARISLMKKDNNTNLSAGIITARDCLHKHPGNRKQGILLLTDGVTNMGVTRPEFVVDIAKNTIDSFPGTSISCIGYGTDHNVSLLRDISAVGGGPYYIVNNLDDVATVFGDILGALVSCSFQQLRVPLPLSTEVKSRFATHKTDAHLEVIVGDLPAGMSAVFLAKLPLGSSVTLKGFHLMNMYEFELHTHVSPSHQLQQEINGEAHYIRFEILKLIEDAQYMMNPYSKDEDIELNITKINEQAMYIKNYMKDHPHTLWSILLEELQLCIKHLRNHKFIRNDTVRISAQRSTYLGRMRGVSASFDDQPAAPPSAANSPFSNAIQREVSSQLHQNILSQEPGAMEEAEAEPGA
jgi:hypothetical protein